MGTITSKSGKNENKVGTKWEQEPHSGARMGREQGGNKNFKRMGTKGEQNGNRMGTRTSKWGKNGNKVGTEKRQEPQSGTRMGTKWRQSGN